MHIRCWGARGSIPVSGPEYNRFGGDTTCLEIRSADDELLVVDAGSGIRRLGLKLANEDRQRLSLLFTHAHWDHLLGFPFFEPIHQARWRIDLYGYPFAQSTVQKIISRTMGRPYFPVQYEDIGASLVSHEVYEDRFQVGSLTIDTILLNHPNLGIGYRFSEGERSFVFLTDNELDFPYHGGRSYEDYVRFAEGADLLLHDAEFDATDYETKRGWGHSLYTDALRLALDAGVQRFGLFHHNQERSDDGVDTIVKACREIVAEHKSALEVFAVSSATEWSL